MNEVRERLRFEYERFYMDCLRQSKAGIFSRSREIEIKKCLVAALKGQIAEGGGQQEKLLALDNILESAYRYVEDYQAAGTSVETLAAEWLEKLPLKIKA